MRCLLAAVRFGRVPKREKAKILEQMQKVNLQSYDGGSGGVEVADEAELMRRIIEAYDQTCQFTSRKAAIFKDEARRKGNYVSCPSKMVNLIFLSFRFGEYIQDSEEF